MESIGFTNYLQIFLAEVGNMNNVCKQLDSERMNEVLFKFMDKQIDIEMYSKHKHSLNTAKLFK